MWQYIAICLPIVTLLIGIVIGCFLTRQSKSDGELEISSTGGTPVLQLALDKKPETIAKQKRVLFDVKLIT